MNEREIEARLSAFLEAVPEGVSIESAAIFELTLAWQRIAALEAALLAITQIQGATPDSKSSSLYPVALYNARQIAAGALKGNDNE